MKKTFLNLLLVAIPATMLAQFKIHQNGYMSFMTTATPQSPISLNCNVNANFFTRYEGPKNALYCSTTNGSNTASFYLTPSSTSNYAVRGQVVAPDSVSSVGTFAMGVWGFGGYSLKNYGVVGTITSVSGGYGAGVYGADNPLWAYAFTKNYAGFFDGEVRIVKDLVVDGTIQGVLLGNASSSSSAQGERLLASTQSGLSTAKQLSRLSLTSFQYASAGRKAAAAKDYSLLRADTSITVAMIREAESARTPSFIQKQNLAKTHYALDAEELGRMFPDLVYEQEDGSKSVNYMEMIPLLVNAIGELSEKISAMESQGSVAATRSNATAVEPVGRAAAASVLYQNTPNPFREQTTIRFSLADDARDASICIFDLTGKILKKLPISSGETSVSVNGWELGEGMFLYTLLVNGREIDTKRMVITK